MPALRLEMYKKVISPLYKITHPDQYKPVQDSVLALLDRAAAPADTLPDTDLEVLEKQ